MQVMFESRDPEASRLRGLAERRVRFVMRRLTWLVPRAHVRMHDINGPRGGVDKRVQIELRTESGGSVVVTSVARDWRSALDTALARAARAIVRAWRRARSHPRAPRAAWPTAA
ncbi:MAG: HPF/RaiA family ribosome-associated protein [Rubrivivax sp.]|nr:HPF/RaiA family ribosome-associated protein [Rubrivivax sp.]